MTSHIKVSIIPKLTALIIIERKITVAEDNRFKMSQERYDAITKELEYLETVRTKEVSELIKEARSFGDLSENSEYDEAKTEQGKVYSKIDELRALVENAEIIEKVETDHDVIIIGSGVKVLDIAENDEMEYKLVGSQEANPREGRISDESPLGRALLGRRAGEKISIEAPDGVIEFKITGVENV